MLEFRSNLVLGATLLAILLILGVANANAVGYQQLDPGYGSATAVAVPTIEQEMVDLRAEIRQAARATAHARLQQALDPGPQWVPATAKVLTLEEEMVDLRAEIRGVARAQAASRLQQALDAGPQWNATSANALAAEVEMFNQRAAFYRAANANAAGQAASANAEASWSPPYEQELIVMSFEERCVPHVLPGKAWKHARTHLPVERICLQVLA